MRDSRGFTLMEVLLSVAILSLLAGLSLPIYQSFQNRNALDIATQSLASAMRRAQVYTRGASGDSQWGVRIQSGQIILFKGVNFAGRDAAFDEVTTIPTSIAITGDPEVVFAKLSGRPDAGGNTTLTSVNNEARTVIINAEGMVTY